MSIIPCVTWVKRGKPKCHPEKMRLNKDDLQRIIEETQELLEEEEEAEEEKEDVDGENTEPSTIQHFEAAAALSKQIEETAEVDTAINMAKKVKNGKAKTKKGKQIKSGHKEDDFESRYNMDDYDDDDQEGLSNPLKGIGNLTVYASNTDDPFVTLKDEDDSEEEDFEIKATDNLLLVAKAESDFCSMEVHVYNSELGNLYCHHDILLSTFPLAMEWMDYDLRDGNPGNFLAIATMDPTIDIWDLDVVDSLEPLATLGQKVKKKKKGRLHVPSHTDAVLDLSWNPLARHVLASASADHTVGLWDLTEGKLAMWIKQHTEKVQCVKWHPVEEHMLLSGSFDKTVKMYDCRSPDTSNKTWNLDGEIEKLLWNRFSPLNFFASTDTGHVYYMDSRQDKPVYSLAAHSESVTGLSLSSENSSLLVTTSSDGSMKVWDIENNKPSCVYSNSLKMGQLLCMESCPDAPYVFAIGGEKKFKLWDIRDIKDVYQHFCTGQGEYVDDPRKDEAEDPEAAMEIEEMKGVTDDTEMGDGGAKGGESAQGAKKKKKRKKKKPKTVV
ncbi:periodic tryptophan protein 1 homolog [Mya arenaria]|uniref:periodic tryptophan protein 1 homolog n=1 Tax=Mya arenaria TaxID=6604 RepID=UPI0022E60E72|nr:periodic tryptophan protein 1 homolog [Mya arenaria]